MEKMKAAVLYDVKDLSVVDVPKPTAGDDGVLIRVHAVGVCGTDLHTYKKGMFKEMSVPIEDGVLFGHEFAGDVVGIGPGVDLVDIKIGDRVVGVAMGAYAEYCRCGPELIGVPVVVKLPENVSYEEAATVEPMTVSLTAVRRADPQPGEKVLIIGAGMIGLGCVQIFHALYPECEVTICDISEKRLDMAKQFGAHRIMNAKETDVVAALKSITGEEGVLYNSKTSAQVDIVMECAGLEVTVNQALEAVKPKTGRVVMVALYEQLPAVDSQSDRFEEY